jgi:hypothetical protein
MHESGCQVPHVHSMLAIETPQPSPHRAHDPASVEHGVPARGRVTGQFGVDGGLHVSIAAPNPLRAQSHVPSG